MFEFLKSRIIIANQLNEQLHDILIKSDFSKIFVLCDSNTKNFCYRIINPSFKSEPIILEIPSGESYKTLDTVQKIWKNLINFKADRKSLMINLGGGVICDMGGFAAGTFKRGIDFINIPTTLLAMVDAAAGGKTGIDFDGLKNEIGTFCPAKYIFINPLFLNTLPKRELISGFAEMIKHGLIHHAVSFNELKLLDIDQPDLNYLKHLIEESVKIKKGFVEQDPKEQGIRKALNFGHTIGHAIESLHLRKGKSILHGEAIAVGLITELVLSNRLVNFPLNQLLNIIGFIISKFPKINLQLTDYESIYELMKHDKKNSSELINFTFLTDFGKILINQTAKKSEIFEALSFYKQVIL